MRAINLMALACGMVLAAAANVHGQEKIRVYTSDLPPWTNEGNAAKPGFAYEIMTEMAKRSALNIDMEFTAWRRAQEQTKSTPNTMVFHLFRTPDRVS